MKALMLILMLVISTFALDSTQVNLAGKELKMAGMSWYVASGIVTFTTILYFADPQGTRKGVIGFNIIAGVIALKIPMHLIKAGKYLSK